MILSLKQELLFQYVTNQLNQFFNDGYLVEEDAIKKYSSDTLYRLKICFTAIKKPYYFENNNTIFNHLNSDHYSMFLYLLSNTIWETDKNEYLATKVFLLNKALHGIDAFYKIKLPDIFLFIHPIGTILGNAKYSNYFVIYQNCTIGSTEDGIYPTFLGETAMFSHSKIIGNCTVGNNTILAANSFIINSNIEHNTIVLNSFPHNNFKHNNKHIIDRLFK